MPESPYQLRQRRLAGVVDAEGFHALLVNPGPSMTYLTGLHFHLSERPIVGIFRPGGRPILILPELEKSKIERSDFDVGTYTYGEDPSSWESAFRQAFLEADVDFGRIAIEPRRLRVLELRFLESAAPRAACLDGSEVMARLRMFKGPEEIALMRRATEIAEAAVSQTVDILEEGITEREVAGELTIQMLRRGSEPEIPFSPIVAFGSETANPHATPRDRRLRLGDLILIDWGASVEGYFSDLTRMFSYGEPDEQLVRITEIVAEANSAGRAAARSGVSAAAVDRAAREVIEASGYGEHFIHRTGHGLGLEGHEEPYIRGDNEQVLEPGMAFTIEPGIYLPGLGGARIEDDVVVTENGLHSLSQLERNLKILNPR